MKILLCHNFYRQRSGEDIAFEYMRDLLQEAGHEVMVFSRDSRAICGLNRFTAAAQVVHSPFMRREIRQLARKEKPDVAIVQNVFPLLSPSIYYGLADAGVPIVQMVFNYRLVCANGQLYSRGAVCERCVQGNRLNGIVRKCYRNSYALSTLYSGTLAIHALLQTWQKKVDLFLIPDEFKKTKLIEAGLPASRMRKICNPFRVDDYRPSYGKGSFALFAGRLIRPKGIYTLLDACLRLPLELKAVIVGDGEEGEGVRQHAAVLQGRAKWLGPVYGNGLRDLLTQCHYLVLPSEWYDCLPMIVCQAFASGKPVIASAINGLPEFVQHERNGLTFPPGDAAALAQAMTRLFCDSALHRRVSENARNFADSVFHPSIWLSRMNRVLREAAETRLHRGATHPGKPGLSQSCLRT